MGVEVGSASKDVEALLATRAQKVAGAEDAVSALCGCQQAVAKACLGCEQKRCRQLENLLAGMHAFIWGSEVHKLAKDPPQLNVMRKLQSQTMGLVEKAWREMVQLAAETLSTDSHALGTASGDMTCKQIWTGLQILQRNPLTCLDSSLHPEGKMF